MSIHPATIQVCMRNPHGHSLFFSTTTILPMHNTTLDLFCNDDDNRDECFDLALEEQAAKYEVTVDYYIEEFLI